MLKWGYSDEHWTEVDRSNPFFLALLNHNCTTVESLNYRNLSFTNLSCNCDSWKLFYCIRVTSAFDSQISRRSFAKLWPHLVVTLRESRSAFSRERGGSSIENTRQTPPTESAEELTRCNSCGARECEWFNERRKTTIIESNLPNTTGPITSQREQVSRGTTLGATSPLIRVSGHELYLSLFCGLVCGYGRLFANSHRSRFAEIRPG